MALAAIVVRVGIRTFLKSCINATDSIRRNNVKAEKQIIERLELTPEELRQILIKRFKLNPASQLDIDCDDSYGFKGLSMEYKKVTAIP